MIVILLILYLTYHGLADTLLMVLAVPGALAGGVLFQSLFGYKFSVTVWVGYIACFGKATATGIIMLVYLRDAVGRTGGLERLTVDELREAVLKGAVQRLRPKLLTECTTVLRLHRCSGRPARARRSCGPWSCRCWAASSWPTKSSTCCYPCCSFGCGAGVKVARVDWVSRPFGGQHITRIERPPTCGHRERGEWRKGRAVLIMLWRSAR
jgi:hypothetical protein